MKTWMKTVAGLFKTRDEAQFAINDLINCGVQPDAITLRSGNVEHHIWSEEEETDRKVKGNEGQVSAQQDVARLVSRGAAHETKIHVGRGDIAALTELGIPEAAAHYYSDWVDRGGYLLTVVVNDDRAEETAMIIQRHGAVEDEHGVWGGNRGSTAAAASLEQSKASRVSPENEPLAHDTLSEQLERAEVFRNKEEVAADRAGKRVQRFVGKEVSLPSANIFGEHDILRFEALQRELPEDKLQKRELRFPEAGAETEVASPGVQSGQQGDEIVGTGEEFPRHFRAADGARGGQFEELYRSAYRFAEAESSSHPQFVDKEWYEVEEEIHRDWERSHPGTWNSVEKAIHLGWDKTRRHH